MVLGLVMTFSVTGHHFKGLPHFSYFENYPQVPQEEFLGQGGDYEFSLVVYDFQGIKQEDVQQPDDVRLYLVIYNLLQNRVYNGPVTLKILDGDQVKYTAKKNSSEEESIYTLQGSLPSSGNYSLAIDLDNEGQFTTIIPFILSSQKLNWGKWVAASLVVLICVVAIGSRKARIKMDRKMNAKQRKEKEVSIEKPETK